MEPRRKPIPNPIPRASGTVRELSPVRLRSGLPTVAALLAVTATLALGCEPAPAEAITGDHAVAHVLPAEHVVVAGPREHDPAEPLPGMGALEEPTPQPVPTVVAPPPPTKPYPVKGGMKAVHPTPIPPVAAGGLKPATPIPPPAKPPKLGGDVAPVWPETT